VKIGTREKQGLGTQKKRKQTLGKGVKKKKKDLQKKKG